MNANIAVEKLLGKADNSIYKLVVLAAKRAQEISAGKPILLETTRSDKPTTIALEEIAAGKVHLKNREEPHKHQVSQMTKETEEDVHQTAVDFFKAV